MKRKYVFVDMQGNRITEFTTREKFTHLRVGYGLVMDTDDYPLSPNTYLRVEGVYRRVTNKRGKFILDTVVVVCSVQREPEDGVQEALRADVEQQHVEREVAPYLPASPEILDQVRVRRRPPRHDPLIDDPRRNLDL
jgi:hypothetical protein